MLRLPDRAEATGNADAAQDLYGLGVRAGIYLQVGGMFFSIFRCRANGTKLTSAGFVLAMLASWSSLVAREAISPVEAHIILELAFIMSLPAYMACFVPGSNVGEGLGFVVTFIALLGYLICTLHFWVAPYRMLPTLGTANKVWSFGWVDLGRRMRIMSLVFAAISLLAVLLLVPVVLAVVRTCLRHWLDRPDDSAGHDASGTMRLVTKGMTLVACILALIFIVRVEVIIKYNGLKPTTDLAQPGQSIPFTIGLLTMLDGTLSLLMYRRTRVAGGDKPQNA